MNNLELIKQVGFDFSWDEKKVWPLNEPITTMPVADLVWHFEMPFWWENGGVYNLSAKEVIENPELHQEEWQRIQRADTSHPLDVMENKGKWLLLDGLHRLVKLFLAGNKEVPVRIIPRSRIPEIMNYDETISECKRTLTEQGFANVYDWEDKPNTEYPAHAHKGKVSFYVIKGSITMKLDQKTIILKPVDRIDVPVGVTHSAVVGSEGCTFVVGEEIEGDS
ncbi:MAG: cupin domain-containing protein [Patescibacteria group bacterium]